MYLFPDSPDTIDSPKYSEEKEWELPETEPAILEELKKENVKP